MKPTQTITLAVLIASSAVCCAGASAQPQSMPRDNGGPSASLDYSRLYNSTYNFGDLQNAKALHYSDNDIASILKIAELTNTRFRDIFSLTESGLTLAAVADRYRLSDSSVRHAQKQKDEIAAYESAYTATGLLGERRQSLAKLEREEARK